VIHDGSEEVQAAFPSTTATGRRSEGSKTRWAAPAMPLPGSRKTNSKGTEYTGDSGSAARFFYSAKADADDRLGSKHPTVKPVALMRWLCRLVTQPGGTVLDPFAGSGTTGMAALAEGFSAILIEREAEYVSDIKCRLAHVSGEDTPLLAIGS
jgi:DNA modification methylase